MENASKALIMAASVLLGLMIISVGVALFNSFYDFGRSTLDKVEEQKIAEWNNNFLKYYGNVATYDIQKQKYITESIKVTAHDIVTVANLAKENNIKYELQNENGYNENIYYVQVKVGNINNFEKKTDTEKTEFIKDNSLTQTNETKYYKCTDVKVSEVTKRVMYIEFQE